VTFWSFTRPLGHMLRGCAGFATTARGGAKERAYCQGCSALPFVPLSVESFGRLGALAISFLRSFADEVVQAGGPCLTQDEFIAEVVQELRAMLSSRSCPLPFAVATRHWVGWARMLPWGPLVAPGCVGLTRSLLRWATPACAGSVFLSLCCTCLCGLGLLLARIGLG
jgi:hypothetical protein